VGYAPRCDLPCGHEVKVPTPKFPKPPHSREEASFRRQLEVSLSRYASSINALEDRDLTVQALIDESLEDYYTKAEIDAMDMSATAIQSQAGTSITGGVVTLGENFDAEVSGASVKLIDRPGVDQGDVSGTASLDYAGVVRINLTADLTVSGISNMDGVSMLILATLNSNTLTFDGTEFRGVSNALSWSGDQTMLISVVDPGAGKLCVTAAQNFS